MTEYTEPQFEKIIEEITNDTSVSTNSYKEFEEPAQTEEKTGEAEEKETIEESAEEEIEEETEEKKQEEIFGKTPDEIEELVNQRTQEAVQKHENTLKEIYEAQASEKEINAQMKEIKQSYRKYEEAITQIDALLEDGQITSQQYRQAINQAVSEMEGLKTEYANLEQLNKNVGLPRIKRSNDTYYQQLEKELPELKDPIIKKYAENLKEKVYNAGGIDMAQGGFIDYVKGFIASAVQEAEIRGYQKVKNEIQKDTVKAKARSAVQNGNSINTRPPISTTEDIINASKEDLLNFMMK